MKRAVEPVALAQKTSRPISTHHLMHLAMLIAVSIWAINMVAIEEALIGFSPLSLSLLRAIAVAIIFGIIFLFMRDRSLLRFTGRRWLQFALIAFLGVTLNQVLIVEGVALTNVPHAALIIAVEPVMVLALSVMMRLEALTTLKFAGMGISFSGVVLLAYGKPTHGVPDYWLGDVILLGEVVVFAYYTILLKEVVDQHDVITLNTVIFGLGALLMIPFGANALLRQRWSQVPMRSFLGLAFMTVFSAVLGYLLFVYALKGLTASRVAAFNYIEPIMATGLGIWLLHDRVGVWGFVGGGLILLGVYFTEREREEEEAS
ncbi:MAG TPA: DMT family transporter [Terriglobia bacterium]|nr:DMT family transporter [Terriglobia bacterium]